VPVALPTNRDKLHGIGIVGSWRGVIRVPCCRLWPGLGGGRARCSQPFDLKRAGLIGRQGVELGLEDHRRSLAARATALKVEVFPQATDNRLLNPIERSTE